MIYLNNKREISHTEWKEIILKLGLQEKVRNAKSIVIKPNFAAGTYANPKSHVMSDLSLLRSCVSFLLVENKKATIYIAEADSTGYGFAYLKFERLGLPESLMDLPDAIQRVRLLDMTRDRLTKIEDKKLCFFTTVDKQLYLSKTLIESDFRISLSNLKTHSVTGYTGACKNLFGCLPDFDKSVYHPVIAKVIHDLTIAIQPDLNIVDAFYGMEKNGPVQGLDVDSGYRIISDNAIEADIYAVKTIGYSVKRVKYLRMLCKTYNITSQSDVNTIKKYAKPGLFLRVMNSLGLLIQGCGQSMGQFGHRIHTCTSLFVLIISLTRPVLLKIFDYEKLRAWKRKFMK